MGPTLAGFNWWITNIMGVPAQYLPAGSPVIQWVYDVAFATVNIKFRCVSSRQGAGDPTAPPLLIYTQMIYNLGGHYLVLYAQDVPDLIYRTGTDGVGIGYFAYQRQQFGLNGFTPGVVQATYDQGTGTTLAVPQGLQNLTANQLQLTKTPWGTVYLGDAQAWNMPWGIS